MGFPEHFVESLRSGAKFGCIGFADSDCPCVSQAFDNQGVFVGNKVLLDRGAERGANALGDNQVFVGNRKSTKRSRIFTPAELFINGPSCLFSTIWQQGDNRVDVRVNAFNLLQMGLQYFNGRDFAGLDFLDQVRGGQKAELRIGHSSE